MKKKIKALVLLSGGLDSILATKLLQKQGLEVEAVAFSTPFFDTSKARKAASQLKVKLLTKNITKNFWSILKNPLFGYGKNMNPCIDCHILMIKEAAKIMKKIGAHFIATGEVLEERPFSQNKKALEQVAKHSGLSGLLLRPLSAKLLPPTLVEEKGWVKRENLLNLSGRSRKRQIALAKKWKITNYPQPASGCLLTDPGYASRLNELSIKNKNFTPLDAELIKHGRIFWEDAVLILIGRNQTDNQEVKRLAQGQDLLMEAKDFKGPLTLIRNFSSSKIDKKVLKKAAYLTAIYGKGRNQKEVEVVYQNLSCKDKTFSIKVKL